MNTPPNLPIGYIQGYLQRSVFCTRLINSRNFTPYRPPFCISSAIRTFVPPYPLVPPARPSVHLSAMIRPYRGISPTIAAGCYIDPSAQLIGDVHLGPQSSLWMNAVVRGDTNSIRIGARTNIQDCAVLHGMRHTHPVIIGSGVTIGHNATVHGCTIEDDVLIGIGATILNGAHIGAGSIIAAGAVIPEHTVIPPNSLVTGVPGKILRTLTEKDLALIQLARQQLPRLHPGLPRRTRPQPRDRGCNKSAYETSSGCVSDSLCPHPATRFHRDPHLTSHLRP